MTVVFFVSAAVAIVATAFAITRVHAVHALLHLIVSLLAVAMMFLALGAPFIAALEVIIYAGAIMVLFVFIVMILNVGPGAIEQERAWLPPGAWIAPSILTLILVAELVYLLAGGEAPSAAHRIGPKEVGTALFGPYAIAVELASILLLAGLIGAYHLGRRRTEAERTGGAT